MKKLFSPEKISLQNHPEITEKIIQEKIAEDPTIIGLGDLILKDKERIQPRSGRLDLLMQDADTNRRYEIEIQLGKTDENHIIRTIEYWDIEKKRYPMYDHCAVLIAEDVTSRFLNIIGLFNGFIPLVAIQMNAFKFGDEIGLVFTKVLDEMPLGLLDEDEEIQAITNRDYWLKRGTEKTVKIADELLDLINSFKPGFTLKYNKFYIGLAREGQPNNFVVFRPKKSFLRLDLRLFKSQEIDEIIEKNGLDEMEYDTRGNWYRIRLNPGDLKKNEAMIKDLLIKSDSYFNT
jgi:hypothetical protein